MSDDLNVSRPLYPSKRAKVYDELTRGKIQIIAFKEWIKTQSQSQPSTFTQKWSILLKAYSAFALQQNKNVFFTLTATNEFFGRSLEQILKKNYDAKELVSNVNELLMQLSTEYAKLNEPQTQVYYDNLGRLLAKFRHLCLVAYQLTLIDETKVSAPATNAEISKLKGFIYILFSAEPTNTHKAFGQIVTAISTLAMMDGCKFVC